MRERTTRRTRCRCDNDSWRSSAQGQRHQVPHKQLTSQVCLRRQRRRWEGRWGNYCIEHLNHIFTADAVLRWELCRSVCLSVGQTRALWQNGRKICPDFYTMRKIIILVFWEKEWLVGDDPFYLKFWVNRTPVGAKSPILDRYSFVAPQS